MASTELNYRITADSLNVGQETTYCPITGILNSAVVHYPPGCNSLVEVFIRRGSNQIFPYPSQTGGASFTNYGVTLDATTQSFELNVSVNRGDPIEVKILNHDGQYEHTISVILLLSEQKSYTGP